MKSMLFVINLEVLQYFFLKSNLSFEQFCNCFLWKSLLNKHNKKDGHIVRPREDEKSINSTLFDLTVYN